jgi:PAS domain S-box-containing protein
MTEPSSFSDYRAVVRKQIESLTETLTKVASGDFTAVARFADADADFGSLFETVNWAIDAARSVQAAVNESQNLLQAVTDNTAAVIFVKDLAGRYLMVNRRYLEVFRLNREDAIDKSDLEIFPKPMAEAFRAMDQRVVAAGRALVEEEIAPDAEGTHVYLSVKSPLRDRYGQIIGVFGISTDVTETKRAEQALRDSEQRTRSIIDGALDAVVTMNGEGVITGWNPQAEATFGWTSAEAIGRSLHETIIPPQHRMAHRRGLQRYLETGEAAVLNKRLELSAVRRDGREFPVELTITPIGTAERRGFCGFVRDISDRKLAQRRLQAQLERLSLLDQVTVAIGERQDLPSIYQVTLQSLEERLPADFACVLSYDGDANTLKVSHVGGRSATLATKLDLRLRSSVAVTENGLAHCVHGNLMHEPDAATLAFPFFRRLSQAGLHAVVLAPLYSDSSVFAVLLVARRVAHGFSSAECEFLRQLSAHVALAAQQAQLYSALEQAYNDLLQTQQAVMQQERLRALGQMASGIAHDINNALTPATLYTETLLETETNLSPLARESLTTIQRAIADIAHTVSRMKEFYRHQPETILLPIQLNPLVRQVVDLTRARWSDMPQQRGTVIEMHVDLAEDLPAIMGLESEIREALVNLVFNAVDAMPEGGALTIRTRLTDAPDRHAALEVGDSGLGMDEATRRRCLEPFFTTKGERGTGLGLPMVYGVAQRHGADLSIDSEIGRGTTVSLHFPTTERIFTHAAEAKPPVPRAKPGRLRVLVVDDDPLLLKSLQHTLETDGHAVIAANGGQAGIDAFLAAQQSGDLPALVITDLGMPHVDGRKLAAAVKAASPTTPIILLTGWGHRLAAEGDIPEHVDQLLSKPPKLADLREALWRHAGAAGG